MFEEIRKITSTVRSLNINDFAYEIWSQEDVQEIIIDLNQIGQLFEKGINSEGNSLGEYTPFTKGKKQEKGQRFDHITLLDTGEFYDSFYIVPNAQGFEIKADPKKESSNLFDDFGKEILGLTADSKEKLTILLITRLQEQLKNKLTR